MAFIDTAQSFSVHRLVEMHSVWAAERAAAAEEEELQPISKRQRRASDAALDAAAAAGGDIKGQRSAAPAFPTASEMLSHVSCSKAFSLQKLMDVIQRLRQRLADQVRASPGADTRSHRTHTFAPACA